MYLCWGQRIAWKSLGFSSFSGFWGGFEGIYLKILKNLALRGKKNRKEVSGGVWHSRENEDSF